MYFSFPSSLSILPNNKTSLKLHTPILNVTILTCIIHSNCVYKDLNLRTAESSTYRGSIHIEYRKITDKAQSINGENQDRESRSVQRYTRTWLTFIIAVSVISSKSPWPAAQGRGNTATGCTNFMGFVRHANDQSPIWHINRTNPTLGFRSFQRRT